MFDSPPPNLDDAVHVIQLSLTPIFLLTAMASLLSVFTARLARVADLVKALADKCDAAGTTPDPWSQRRLAALRRRSLLLDAAVILAAISGGCTCLTVLALFVGVTRASATQGLLFTTFGLAILCIIASLAAFLGEVLLASRNIRQTVDASVTRVEF